ncbi:hypothetical protein JCM3765_004191 [Sporobolomyces pararoseus]
MTRPRVIFEVSNSEKPTSLAREGERLSGMTSASTGSGELMQESESGTSRIGTEQEDSLYQQSSSSVSRNGNSSNGENGSSSASGGSSNSQLYKSINRLFSSTYARDSRFPETPPRHYSPNAVPHSHRYRIPPLNYAPYVRPAILKPFSDVYSPKYEDSAHLIYPMSSFVADLTLALEVIEVPLDGDGDGKGGGGGEQRPLYGVRFTPPPEGQRDPSGLYRPLETPEPTSSLNPSEGSSNSRNGNGNRK